MGARGRSPRKFFGKTRPQIASEHIRNAKVRQNLSAWQMVRWWSGVQPPVGMTGEEPLDFLKKKAPERIFEHQKHYNHNNRWQLMMKLQWQIEIDKKDFAQNYKLINNVFTETSLFILSMVSPASKFSFVHISFLIVQASWLPRFQPYMHVYVMLVQLCNRCIL